MKTTKKRTAKRRQRPRTPRTPNAPATAPIALSRSERRAMRDAVTRAAHALDNAGTKRPHATRIHAAVRAAYLAGFDAGFTSGFDTGFDVGGMFEQAIRS